MLLRLSRGEETIREAMDLHEWGAAPALNELSGTKQAPNQCVVLGANQVVGYLATSTISRFLMLRVVEQRGGCAKRS